VYIITGREGNITYTYYTTFISNVSIILIGPILSDHCDVTATSQSEGPAPPSGAYFLHQSGKRKHQNRHIIISHIFIILFQLVARGTKERARLGWPFFGREIFILKTMMFREVGTILNEREHFKMLIRSVLDYVSLILSRTE
jgi:hypothetical protein